MRVFLAVFFVIAGTAAGLAQGAKLKRREQLLSEVIRLLENLAVQIRYRALPLGEFFAGSVSSNGRFTERITAHINSGVNWRGAWSEAVCDFAELDDGDREILAEVGSCLGGSDAAGQISMLELNKELLTARLKEATADSAKKAAMYRSVGLLSGLAIGIMVL
ncbi:MAG: stage III sporulation protein AB [Oscillospiraceae bacterium]|nr:stage III sporulation protein AB [Oscillospiraceae bacterium]